MGKQAAVYIMASRHNGTLYTGVTSDIRKRDYEHRTGAVEGFTRRYGCTRLVYVEFLDDMMAAIAREKQIKGGSRKKKLELIEHANPDWLDLFDTIL